MLPFRNSALCEFPGDCVRQDPYLTPSILFSTDLYSYLVSKSCDGSLKKLRDCAVT